VRAPSLLAAAALLAAGIAGAEVRATDDAGTEIVLAGRRSASSAWRHT